MFPPALWGRVRRGRTATSNAAPSSREVSATPHPGLPPQGGKGKVGALRGRAARARRAPPASPRGRARRSPAAPSRASRRRTAAGARIPDSVGSPPRRRGPRARRPASARNRSPAVTPPPVTRAPSRTTRASTGTRAERGQEIERSPMRRRALAPQQPRGAQNQRARAHRGDEARALGLRADERQSPLVAHQRVDARPRRERRSRRVADNPR